MQILKRKTKKSNEYSQSRIYLMIALIFMVLLFIGYIFLDKKEEIKFVIEYVEKAVALFSTYSFGEKLTKDEDTKE